MNVELKLVSSTQVSEHRTASCKNYNPEAAHRKLVTLVEARRSKGKRSNAMPSTAMQNESMQWKS